MAEGTFLGSEAAHNHRAQQACAQSLQCVCSDLHSVAVCLLALLDSRSQAGLPDDSFGYVPDFLQ